jgi:hypothetical protein
MLKNTLIIGWLLFFLVGGVYFPSHGNAKLKKRLHLGWCLFGFVYTNLLFAYRMDYGALFFSIPSTVVIICLGYGSSDFCEACDASLVKRFWPGQRHICPECGADLANQRFRT